MIPARCRPHRSVRLRTAFAGAVLVVACISLFAVGAAAQDTQAAGAVPNLNKEPKAQAAVIALTSAIVIVCVLIHYEALRLLSQLLPRLKALPRARVVVLIFGLLIAHQVEVWVYAVGYFLMVDLWELSHLAGPVHTGFMDHVYFSMVNFSTLGYGDIIPVGPIRFLTAMESLNGLVLITWSASFTFLEMQRFWKED